MNKFTNELYNSLGMEAEGVSFGDFSEDVKSPQVQELIFEKLGGKVGGQAMDFGSFQGSIILPDIEQFAAEEIGPDTPSQLTKDATNLRNNLYKTLGLKEGGIDLDQFNSDIDSSDETVQALYTQSKSELPYEDFLLTIRSREAKPEADVLGLASDKDLAKRIEENKDAPLQYDETKKSREATAKRLSQSNPEEELKELNQDYNLGETAEEFQITATNPIYLGRTDLGDGVEGTSEFIEEDGEIYNVLPEIEIKPPLPGSSAAQNPLERFLPKGIFDPSKPLVPMVFTEEGARKYFMDTTVPAINKRIAFEEVMQRIQDQNERNGYISPRRREELNDSYLMQQYEEQAAKNVQDNLLMRGVVTPVNNLFRSFGRGATEVASNILGIPRFANDLVAASINGVIENSIQNGASFLEGTQAGYWDEAYGNTMFDRVQHYMNGAIKRFDMEMEAELGTKDIFDTFKSGEIIGAYSKVANQVGASAPAMLSLMAMGGGIESFVGGSAIFSSGKYDQLRGTQIPQDMKLLGSLAHGYAESLFENIGNKYMLKGAEAILKREGKEVAEKFIKDTSTDVITKAFGKHAIITGEAMEVITEIATTISQNGIAIVIGEDPDRKLSQGVLDTAITAFATAKSVGGVTRALSRISSPSARTEVAEMSAVNEDIKDAMSGGMVPADAQSELYQTLQENNEKINNHIAQDNAFRESLSPENRKKLEELDVNKEAILRIVEDPNISDAVKSAFAEKMQTIDTAIEGIYQKNSKIPEAMPNKPEPSFLEKLTSPELLAEEEAKLKEYFKGYVDNMKNLGIAPQDNQQSAQQDIEFIKNATKYVALQFAKGVHYTKDQLSTLLNVKLSDKQFKDIESGAFDSIIDLDNKIRLGEVTDEITIARHEDVITNMSKAMRDIQAVREIERPILDIAKRRDMTVQKVVEGIKDGSIKTKFIPEITEDLVTRLDEVVARNPPDINLTTQSDTLTPGKTKSNVKDVTDGGTRGTITKSVRAAMKDHYDALSKGAREGARDARRTMQDGVATAQKAFKDAMKSAGVKSLDLNKAEVNRVFNLLARSHSDKYVNKLTNYLQDLVTDAKIEESQRVVTKQLKNAKKASRSENLPANIKSALGEFSRIKPEAFLTDDVNLRNDLESLAETGSELLRDARNAKNTLSRWGTIGVEQFQSDVAKMQERLNDAFFEDNRADMEAGIDELYMQMEKTPPADHNLNSYQEYLDRYDSVSFELSQWQEANPNKVPPVPDKVDKLRENSLSTIEFFRNDIENLDRTEFLPNENLQIDRILKLNPDLMTTADLAKLSLGLANLTYNGKLDGLGSVLSRANSENLSADTSFVAKIKDKVLKVPALFNKHFIRGNTGAAKEARYFNTSKNILGVSQRMRSLFKDDKTMGLWNGRIGAEDYKQGKNRASRRYEEKLDQIKSLIKNDADIKEFFNADNRAEREHQLGVVAYLNQFDVKDSPERRQTVFEKKRKALREMLDRAKKVNSHTRKDEMSAYITHMEAVLPRVEALDSYTELESILGKGEAKMYYFSMNSFADIKDEFLSNARIYSNRDLDAGIDNYIPIDYIRTVEETIEDRSIAGSYESSFYGSALTGRNQSGSARDRVIKAGELPRNSIVNFSFLETVYKNYGLQLSDIETQGPRLDIKTNLNNKKLRDGVGNDMLFKSMGNIMEGEMEKNKSFIQNVQAQRFRDKLFNSITTATYGSTLGGFAQLPKQAISAYLSSNFMDGFEGRGIYLYLKDRAKMDNFMKDQDVFKRGAVSSFSGGSNANTHNVNPSVGKFKKVANLALDVNDHVVNKYVLAPLKMGDVYGARASWINYYLKYADKNGIEVNFDEAPNKEAAAYADIQIDTSQNSSDDTKKAEFTKHWLTKAFLPFSSASVASMGEFMVASSKMATAIRTGDMKSAANQAGVLGTNVGTLVLFQSIGYGIRLAGLRTFQAMAQSLIGDDPDEFTDEEDKQMEEEVRSILDAHIAKSKDALANNFYKYAIDDVLFRGLAQSGLQPLSDLVTGSIYEGITGEEYRRFESQDKMQEMLSSFGIYGIPIRNTLNAFEKSKAMWNFEGYLEDKGYGVYMKADGTVGYNLKLPKSQVLEKYKIFSMVNGLMAIPPVVGVQDQFVSSMTRQSNIMMDKAYKGILKDVPKADPDKFKKAYKKQFDSIGDGDYSLDLKAMGLSSDFQRVYETELSKNYSRLLKEYDLDDEDVDYDYIEEQIAEEVKSIATEKFLNKPEYSKIFEEQATKKKGK